MSRWHNGPGVCRAKSGSCPFGGEDFHFDSKKEASKVYNEQNANEFGILPGMNNDKKKTLERQKSLQLVLVGLHYQVQIMMKTPTYHFAKAKYLRPVTSSTNNVKRSQHGF